MQVAIAILGLILLAVVVFAQRRRRTRIPRDVLLDEALHDHLQSLATSTLLKGTGILQMPSRMLLRLRSTVQALVTRDRETCCLPPNGLPTTPACWKRRFCPYTKSGGIPPGCHGLSPGKFVCKNLRKK